MGSASFNLGLVGLSLPNISKNMKPVFVFSFFLLTAYAASTERCNEVRSQFNECTRAAHQTYINAMKRGDDGRPNFRARKTCNYLVDSIENCGNKLLEDDCNTEEAVTNMKDNQISKVMESIGQTVADFDSCKCPAVKAHLNRMKAAEGADVAECPDDFDYAFAGASKGFVSVLLLLPILVLHHLY